MKIGAATILSALVFCSLVSAAPHMSGSADVLGSAKIMMGRTPPKPSEKYLYQSGWAVGWFLGSA